MTTDPLIRQLRRLLEMQAAARHGMTNAALGGADPAENDFIAEEVDRMTDMHHALTAAIEQIEAGETGPETARLVAEAARLRPETPWADSDLLDRFVAKYGGGV